MNKEYFAKRANMILESENREFKPSNKKERHNKKDKAHKRISEDTLRNKVQVVQDDEKRLLHRVTDYVKGESITISSSDNLREYTILLPEDNIPIVLIFDDVIIESIVWALAETRDINVTSRCCRKRVNDGYANVWFMIDDYNLNRIKSSIASRLIENDLPDIIIVYDVSDLEDIDFDFVMARTGVKSAYGGRCNNKITTYTTTLEPRPERKERFYE